MRLRRSPFLVLLLLAGLGLSGLTLPGGALPGGRAVETLKEAKKAVEAKKSAKPGKPAPARPRVYYLRAAGVINPVMAEFIVANISKAEADGAAALVIELDTPGGLDTSMREIIKRELASTVPIVVYVAPAGSRAASAGVFIAYAAHIAAMTPGTNIGSAHPVAMGGGKMDKTMLEKVENDAAAYIRGIATKRHRNAKWAEEAVRKSVNVTAEEALELRVINLLAKDRAELLEKIDGMKVDLLAGPAVVRTKGAAVQVVEMGLRERILKAISDPNVAYVLMMIGILGLYFELSNPGAVFPGVVGAISLVLAFYALHTLNINYAGLILIGLAFVFFIVEINVISYGLLTLAGLVSLILGSIMLFDSPLPFMRLSPWVMMPAVVFMTGFVAFTLYMAVRLQGRRSVAGAEGIIGANGRVVDEIRPGSRGKVFVAGEYWDAVSDKDMGTDEEVEVVGIEGLLLTVRRKKGSP
jgi:membrane-bound serine protease (ClpP class)